MGKHLLVQIRFHNLFVENTQTVTIKTPMFVHYLCGNEDSSGSDGRNPLCLCFLTHCSTRHDTCFVLSRLNFFEKQDELPLYRFFLSLR